MSCINDIVSLGYCDGEVSKSGLTLMQAAGMSPINADKIATEQYGSGYNLLKTKKTLAQILVRNDFTGFLNANNIASSITERIYDSSIFSIGTDMGLYDGYRGVNIYSIGTERGGLRKLKIKTIQCYPLASGAGTIHIIDSISGIATVTPISVTFVANQLNTFFLPIPYICQNKKVSVVIDNSTINFCSAEITCKTGCNGTQPNNCAWCDGYNGIGCVKSEGYGVNVQFTCECDYDQLICDFSTSFTGELIWLKMQELVFDEQYKSNRFDGWVIYDRDDIWDNVLPNIRAQYNTKFNSMVQSGIIETLKQYRDECLLCRGVRYITNV